MWKTESGHDIWISDNRAIVVVQTTIIYMKLVSMGDNENVYYLTLYAWHVSGIIFIGYAHSQTIRMPIKKKAFWSM
jgi:hypothetical protein